MGDDGGACADSAVRSPPVDPPAVVAPRRRRRRTSGAAAALLGLFLLGGGATGVILVTSGQGRADAPPAAGRPVGAAPHDAPTGVLSAGGPTADPTAPGRASADPSVGSPSADPVSVVESYYALLPDDVGPAYAMLSPQAQQQSGGQGPYADFWADVEAVTLRDTRQISDSTVSTLVRVVQQDGTVTNELYRVVVVTGSDGRPLLQSFDRL